MAESRSLTERKNASYTQAKDATDQERTDVSGNVRSPPIDGSNEASDTGEPGLDSEEGAGQGGSDTGVERQGDNQDGDEAGRPVQLDGRQAKGYYSDPVVSVYSGTLPRVITPAPV